MKVINLGVYPPPYGGVSIYLSRLREHLLKTTLNTEFIDVSIQNEKDKINNGIRVMSLRQTLTYLLFHKRAILHFHKFSWGLPFLYRILASKHAVILSFHNERFLQEIEKAPAIIKDLVIKFLNSLNYIIVDNKKCQTLADTIIADKSKILLIPEFIPPSNIPHLNDHSLIIEMREKHRFLLSSNAWQLSFHNNADLYGIDMLIELVARLTKDNIDIGLVFLLPQIGDEAYFLRLKKQITMHDISERFLFITDPLEEASSLWRISDLVLRATNTDGNSLTVLESLSVGTPVLASDCAPRPDGVLLFKTRDFDDLHKKTREVLSDINNVKSRIRNLHIENNANNFVTIYKSIIEADK